MFLEFKNPLHKQQKKMAKLICLVAFSIFSSSLAAAAHFGDGRRDRFERENGNGNGIGKGIKDGDRSGIGIGSSLEIGGKNVTKTDPGAGLQAII